MRITTTTDAAIAVKGDVLILPVGDAPKKWPTSVKAVDKKLKGGLSGLVKDGFFAGKEGETCWAAGCSGLGVRHVLLVGLGANSAPKELQNLYRAIAKAGRQLREKKIRRVVWLLTAKAASANKMSITDYARKIADELVYAQYKFDRHKSEKKPITLRDIVLLPEGKADARKILQAAKAGAIMADGANYARDLGNAPGNTLTPADLAAQAKKLAKAKGFKCTVLNEADIRKLKMGGLLGVAQGSSQPPKLIVLEYKKGRAGDPPVALVGKGLTFDSGGISLKPGLAMDEMKFDMCGSAAVLGAFHAVASAKRKINLVGVIPATENMPGGRAIKPGDVITAMSGKTIEVLNTDAEGRLVLADALTYAQKKFKPSMVVDLATLTGAVVIGLGHHATGLMSNDGKLGNALVSAGAATGDRVWPLPTWQDYSDQIKGTVADIANIGGRPGGTLTAGAFLKEFIEDGQAWAHLDIAGTAWTSAAKPHVEKGATAVGVRLLTQWLAQM
jgi:leucyl aminopeptidase